MPSSGMKLPAIATALLLVVVSAAPATASPGNHRLDIDVLSSRADQVTGGDAVVLRQVVLEQPAAAEATA